jgi:enterochelin esterase-like enzyme
LSAIWLFAAVFLHRYLFTQSLKKGVIMKKLVKMVATAMLCSFMLLSVAQPSMDYNILIEDIEIQPGVTIDINVNVFVNENAQSWSNTGKIIAIEGMAHTGQCMKPLAEALFENTDPAMEINEFFSIDSPGKGLSGLPLGEGFLLEDLYMEDYMNIYFGVISHLNNETDIYPRTILGHSLGGMMVLKLQDTLVKHGTNLKEQYGINNCILLAPAIPAPLDWSFIGSPSAQALFDYVEYFTPEYGTILNLPPVAWVFSLFTNTCCYFPPNTVPGAPTPAEASASGYIGIEPVPLLLQATGTPIPPPLPYPAKSRIAANPGIFMVQNGVQLTIIADEFDRMMSPAEETNLYLYLTNDATLANMKTVLGEETCHDTHISDPHAVTELITLPFNPVNAPGEYTILKDQFFSDALGHQEMVDIWLPPHYFDYPDQQYPVVYFLHKAFSNESDYEYFLPLLNQMTANGEIDPFIIVKPNGWAPPYLGSCWYNSPLYGNYEDMVIQDLIPYIEENYRVIEGQDFRYHMGQSMGGHAGWSMSIRFPELFGAVADIAGYKNMTMTVPMLTPGFLAEQGGTPPYSYSPMAGQLSMLVYTTLGAYNANMAKPPYFVDIFLDENGDIITEYLDDFLSDDIITMIPGKAQPPNTKYFIAQGFYDNVVPYPTTIAFNQVLDDNDWEYEFFTWEGGHFDVLPALEEGFRFLDGVWKEKQQTQTINAPQGWSLISTCMMPADPSVDEILADPALIFALGPNGFYWPGQNVNTMQHWFTKSNALKVKTANMFNLNIDGIAWEDKTVQLNQGVNYLPVLSGESVPAPAIFDQLGATLLYAFEIANSLIYWPAGGLYTLQTLEPGTGYLAITTAPGMVNFGNIAKCHYPIQAQKVNAPANVNSGMQHFVVIDPEALNGFNPGTVFTATNKNGQIVASTALTDRNLPVILAVNGDDPTTQLVDGLIAGEQIFISAISPESDESFALEATFDTGIGLDDIFAEWGISKVLRFKETTGVNKQETYGSLTITPNPVTSQANLSWNMSRPGQVSIALLDNHGGQVIETVNSYFNEGQCSTTISTLGLSSGIYFCRLTTTGYVMMKKIVVMR